MKVVKRYKLREEVKDLLLECLGLFALIVMIQSIVMLYMIIYGG